MKHFGQSELSLLSIRVSRYDRLSTYNVTFELYKGTSSLKLMNGTTIVSFHGKPCVLSSMEQETKRDIIKRAFKKNPSGLLVCYFSQSLNVSKDFS
jgi:hypothetical protein